MVCSLSLPFRHLHIPCTFFFFSPFPGPFRWVCRCQCKKYLRLILCTKMYTILFYDAFPYSNIPEFEAGDWVIRSTPTSPKNTIRNHTPVSEPALNKNTPVTGADWPPVVRVSGFWARPWRSSRWCSITWKPIHTLSVHTHIIPPAGGPSRMAVGEIMVIGHHLTLLPFPLFLSLVPPAPFLFPNPFLHRIAS